MHVLNLQALPCNLLSCACRPCHIHYSKANHAKKRMLDYQRKQQALLLQQQQAETTTDVTTAQQPPSAASPDTAQQPVPVDAAVAPTVMYVAWGAQHQCG